MRFLACLGLAVGGVFGMAGSFAPTASLRGLAWGVDGIALVMASALLTVLHYRGGQDLIAAGFLVFAVGQGIIVSGASLDPAASAPSFGAGVGLWAMSLVLVGIPRTFPVVVRLLGFSAALLFAITAAQILAGRPVTALSKPLPSFAYPVLVATFVGWIQTILKGNEAPKAEQSR